MLIVSGVLLVAGCSENTSVKKLVDLQVEEKQNIIAISGQFNTLLRQKATINFIKTCMQQSDKATFMMDYLSQNFNNEQKGIAKDIIGHFFNTTNKDLRAKTAEDGYFTLSPTVNQLTKKLTRDMKNVMVASFNEGQSTDHMINSLKSVIMTFKSEVQGNTLLTLDETIALIAFAELQNNSIGEIVSMANGLNSNSAGRTQGWRLSSIISVVLTAVVASVVVVAIVVASGGIALVIGGAIAASVPGWFATAVAVGAIVGGIYGGVIGYDMSVNKNSYFTDFDPENVGGAFLDWEHCTTNPGHWACI